MNDYAADSEDTPKGDDEALYTQVKAWYGPDNEKFKLWWKGASETDKGAEEDFKFRDGDQWSADDKQTLIDQERPVLVFNRTGVLVDAVVGAEIGNRREVRFYPREQNDAKPNELLTSAAEWFRDQCDAEDEETEAFKDTVTAGMGWTETRLDFEVNEAGDPVVDHFDPREARWDHNSTKANLVDSKRRWRVRKMLLADAKAMFPGFEDEDYNASWADDESSDGESPRRIEEGNRYNGEGKEASTDKRVTIVGCQYFQKVPYYKALILGPDGMPQQVELDQKKFDIAQASGAVLKSVKLSRKKVVVCYLGAKVLKKPAPTQTGDFTWQCITGLKDHNKGVFYGIVRRAKDPQRWANKWLSQMMHILNSQAKGGVMAEKDAFENQRQAEESWAASERITWLKKGALSGPQGTKIQAKPVAVFPAGFDRLLQYADDAIIKSTGINMELLGMRDATQPGVLEYQRKQAGVTILASFFDSLRRYRKLQGRGMLYLIQNFLSDGRLVRIVGEEETKYVPLTKEAATSAEYDVIVDDSPTSTNEKEKTWQLLQGVLPMLKGMVTPDLMLMLAEYSPLPSSLVEKLKGAQKQAQQDPQSNPAVQLEQQRMQLEAEKMKLEGDKIALERMKVQQEAASLGIQLQIEQVKAGASVATAQAKADAAQSNAINSMISAANPPQMMTN
jgi:hypothetical protein